MRAVQLERARARGRREARARGLEWRDDLQRRLLGVLQVETDTHIQIYARMYIESGVERLRD